MKIQTLAIAACCLALSTAPGFAVSLNLGGAADISIGSDSGVSVGLGADASAGESSGITLNANLGLSGAGTAAGTTASGAATTSLADSLSASDTLAPVVRLIESSDWSASSFANIDGVANGTTYDIHGMVNADNQATLDAALSGHATEIGELQAALAANASLNSWLEAQGTEASEVIALGVAADGSLAVFTN